MINFIYSFVIFSLIQSSTRCDLDQVYISISKQVVNFKLLYQPYKEHILNLNQLCVNREIKSWISNLECPGKTIHQVQNQKIGNPHHFKIFGSKKTKRSKKDRENQLWLPLVEGDES